MEKVLIKVDSKDFPFYKTMRGVLEFSESGFTGAQMMEGNVRAILSFIYCYVRGACFRESIAFDFDFETFINKVDDDAIEKIENFLKSQAVAPADDTKKKP